MSHWTRVLREKELFKDQLAHRYFVLFRLPDGQKLN